MANPLRNKMAADITSRREGVGFKFHGDVLPTQILTPRPRNALFLYLLWLKFGLRLLF
jgi:hypothetical protein